MDKLCNTVVNMSVFLSVMQTSESKFAYVYKM